MTQRYIAFSFRTMTFVMFCIYFTFIFTFILPLDTLSKHTWTAPALLYTLLLSSSQSWGWVSQIRLCQVEAAVMKSGVTPTCYSLSCTPTCYSFSCLPVCCSLSWHTVCSVYLLLCMRYVLVIPTYCLFSSLLCYYWFAEGEKKSRLLGGVLYLLLCCTDVSTVVFSIE